MLADEYAELEFLDPRSRGGTTVHIHLYVDDVDATVMQAVAAGGKLKRPVQDQFYDDAPERSRILSAMFGTSRHIRKISHPRNWCIVPNK
jgi:PhnB protein